MPQSVVEQPKRQCSEVLHKTKAAKDKTAVAASDWSPVAVLAQPWTEDKLKTSVLDSWSLPAAAMGSRDEDILKRTPVGQNLLEAVLDAPASPDGVLRELLTRP